MSKKYFYSLVILVIVGLPFFIHEERLRHADEVASVSTHYQTLQSINTVSERRQIKIECSTDQTVFECMQQRNETAGFTFRGRTFPSLGFFVDEINGLKNTKGFYWTLYINGAYSTVGASQYVVRTGDVIEWKYEKK